ncbi:terpene synthase metal-binding domain-containing protein [Penicillium vulpinum]|uniref:Terpene synthase n=1 Tax=Penicillium vulpinum TaxID=29845 RepID=A0A1V6RTT1_9EURO|nr:terpene synthase metal-binding domain-containing protein [Penicillium vulpinum]KAJ5971451.1 terpene synthase metal-binding domain-containing protein [Penicillium vulpinum]OQE05185.1 hypothetical protein PENVUL_c026G04216 [Penicillium vulpinum]
MGNIIAEIEFTSLRIPTFELPWPERISPNVELIETRMLEWAERYELFPNQTAYKERVKRTRYAWLAARCYPNASPELLQTIANYFVWFFLADDLFVDRVEKVSPDTLRNLTAMIDVLDFNCASQKPVYGELAWLDVCKQLRRLLAAENFERFAQGMRLWSTTAALQILSHLQDKPVGIRQYETIRRHTSGMNPCLALSDAANIGAVGPDEYYHPDVQRLCRHANNIVCWSNDIQSLGIEMRQPGQFWNMVGTYAGSGYTLQESVDYTAERVKAEIISFKRLSHKILLSASPQLCGLVQGYEYWIRGYIDWVMKDTKRYATEFAAGDADDRDVLSSQT